MNMYLIWEREYIGEHSVIMVTQSEDIAKKLTGEKNPCHFGEKENYKTNRCYEVRELEKLYCSVDPG